MTKRLDDTEALTKDGKGNPLYGPFHSPAPDHSTEMLNIPLPEKPRSGPGSESIKDAVDYLKSC